MTNANKSNEDATSLQLIESLKKEVLLMRELLSAYSTEEDMVHREDMHMLSTVKEKQNKFKQDINQLRKNRQHSHAEESTDFNLDILKLQIEALNQEIINKMALLKCLISIPKKVKPKKKKKTILLVEEDV